MNYTIYKNNKGFTLVEILVAVAIFSVVMVMCMGSILSVIDANQKAKSLRSVMDNLSISLESMTRTIRFGTNYHCGGNGTGDPASPRDCGGAGDNTLTVKSDDGVEVTYSLVNFGSLGRIARALNTNGGTNYFLTSPDVNITNLKFRVYGSGAFNNGLELLQPEVIIVISGYVGVKTSTRSTFTLETTISQKILDFQ